MRSLSAIDLLDLSRLVTYMRTTVVAVATVYHSQPSIKMLDMFLSQVSDSAGDSSDPVFQIQIFTGENGKGMKSSLATLNSWVWSEDRPRNSEGHFEIPRSIRTLSTKYKQASLTSSQSYMNWSIQGPRGAVANGAFLRSRPVHMASDFFSIFETECATMIRK